MKRTRSAKFNIAVTVALIGALILCCLTFGFIQPTKRSVAVTADEAKTMGESFETYAAANQSIPTVDIYTMSEVRSMLFSSTVDIAPGIITANGAEPALLQNSPYNYCILIATAADLIDFSFFTAGYDPLRSSTFSQNATLADFFRSANVKLANDIHFNGDLTFYQSNGLTKYVSLSGGATTAAYTVTTNSAYQGYGSGMNAFMPISSFGGTFDGQNFAIYDLTITVNGNSSKNSAGYNAFFASVLATATVKNFGLIDAKFAQTDQTDTTVSYPYASIAGTNAGAIDYVYAAGVTLLEGSSLPTVAVNSGTLSNYYTADVTVNGGAAVGDSSYTPTDGRWYGGNDYVMRKFAADHPTLHKLSGVRYVASLSYAIYTPADLVAFSSLVKENLFNGKAVVNVEIANDLDCAYLSKTSYIQADPLGGNNVNYVLYGKSNTTIEGVTNRAVIRNLQLGSYLEATGSSVSLHRSYGLFGVNFRPYTTDGGAIFRNINFLNCTVPIESSTEGGFITAGLFAGFTVWTIRAYGVGFDGRVGYEEDTVNETHQGVRLGGFVGTYGNAGASNLNSITAQTYFNTVASTADVYTGVVSVATGSTAAEHNFTTGGVIGFADGNARANRADGVYIGGTITGPLPVQGSSSAIGASNVGIGGYIGRGPVSAVNGDNTTTQALIGIYVASTINNIPENPVRGMESIDSGQFSIYIGGIMGNAAGTNTAFVLNTANSMKFAGTINASTHYTLVGETSKMRATEFSVGGLVGGFNKFSIYGTEQSPLKVSEIVTGNINFETGSPCDTQLSISYGNLLGVSSIASYSYIENDKPIQFGTENRLGATVPTTFGDIGAANSYIGGIIGRTSGNITASYLTNTADITVGATYGNVGVGGIIGDSSSTSLIHDFSNFTNSGNVTAIVKGAVTTLTVLGVGSGSVSASSTLKNCVNTGEVAAICKVDSTLSAVVDGVSENGIFTDCTNEGDVYLQAKGVTFASAVISGVGNNGKFTNCINRGSISLNDGYAAYDASAPLNNFTAKTYISGIGYSGDVSNCTNEGSVYARMHFSTATSGNLYISGIRAKDDNQSISDSTNLGAISFYGLTQKSNYAIVTGIATLGNISNCVNGSSTDPTAAPIYGSNAYQLRVGGITHNAATVTGCTNYGAVTYGGTSYNLRSGGIASGSASTITNNKNRGAVTAESDTTATNSLYVGGIASDIGNSTVDRNINYAAVKAVNTSSSGINCIGGIIGSVSNSANDAIVENCVNTGEVYYDGAVNGFVGGIIGSMAAGSVYSCYNDAQISFEQGAGGGIVGYASADTSKVIGDCFNFGKVTALSTDTSKQEYIGGIIGYTNGNGTIYVYDNVNSGEVIANGRANIGGIVGVSGQIGYFYSNINYGAITGYRTAGIIARSMSANQTVVNGAVNYGVVTGTNESGALIGNFSGNPVTLSNAIAYDDTASTTYPYCVTSTNVTIKAVIHVKPSGATVYENSTSGSALTIDELYGNTFFLHKDNEYDYYKANAADFYGSNEYSDGATVSPTLVWSAYPYAPSHSTATGTYVFAVTTSGGRADGRYTGENFYESTITGIDSVYAPQLIAKLNATRQITATRDVFIRDPAYLKLIDGAKSTPLQELPLAQYYPNGVAAEDGTMLIEKDSIVVTITNGSDYFTQNAAAGSTSFIGVDTVLASDFGYALSQGANYDLTFNAAECGELRFDTQSSYEVVVSATIRVWQGNDREAEGRYRDYPLIVQYYNSTPTLTLDEGDDALTLNRMTEINGTESVTALYGDTSVGTSNSVVEGEITTVTNTKTYDLRPTQTGDEVDLEWLKEELSARFVIHGSDESSIVSSSSSALYYNDTTYGADWKPTGIDNYTAFTESGYYGVDVTTSDFTQSVISPTITVPMGKITVKFTATDSLLNYELKAGRWRYDYTLTLNLGSTVYVFVRSFYFNKAASGNVFVHHSYNGLPAVNNAPHPVYTMSARFVDFANPTGTERYFRLNNAYYTSGTVSGNEYTFTDTRTLDNSYYGALPSVNALKQNDLYSNPFGFFYNAGTSLQASKYATASNPSIVLTKVSATTYEIEYSFVITAQNGNTGRYVFNFNVTNVAPVTQALSAVGTFTGNEIEVGKTGSESVTADYSFQTAAANYTYVGYMAVVRTEMIYRAGSDSDPILAATITQDGTVYESGFDDFKLPTATLTNNRLSVQIASDTSGGIYAFRTYIQHTGTLAAADYSGLIQIKGSDGASIDALSLDSYFYSSAQSQFTIDKQASRAAYVYGIGFSGNLPQGGYTLGYATSGLTDVGQMTLTDNGAMSTMNYASTFVNADTATANQWNARIPAYRARFSFDLSSGADYSTDLRLYFGGEYASDANNIYNDETVSVYVMTNVNGTWTQSSTPMSLLTGTDTQGNEYTYADIHLPESTLVRIRVRAGNPGYYNDFEFLSEGPLRNKTFNINVSTDSNVSSAEFEGHNFVIMLSIRYLVAVDMYAQRTTNLLFSTQQNGNSILENNAYSADYMSTLNSAGTYSLSLSAITPGYDAVISTVTVTSGNNSNLSYTSGSNAFTVSSDDAMVLDISIKITKTDETEFWGDRVFG